MRAQTLWVGRERSISMCLKPPETVRHGVPLQHSCQVRLANSVQRRTFRDYVMIMFMCIRSVYLHSPPQTKKGWEWTYERWKIRVLSQPGSSLPGLTSVTDVSGSEANSSMQKIMVAVRGTGQGQMGASPSQTAAAIYISERQKQREKMRVLQRWDLSVLHTSLPHDGLGNLLCL